MSKFNKYLESVQKMNIQESHFVFEFVDHCEDNGIKEPTEKDIAMFVEKHVPSEKDFVTKILKKNINNIKEILK